MTSWYIITFQKSLLIWKGSTYSKHKCGGQKDYIVILSDLCNAIKKVLQRDYKDTGPSIGSYNHVSVNGSTHGIQ